MPCDLVHSCPIPSGKNTSRVFKRRYCVIDPYSCARYKTAPYYQAEPVPDWLEPHMHNEAQQLISVLTVN